MTTMTNSAATDHPAFENPVFAGPGADAGGRSLALFDLDGTLTDPAEGIAESFRQGFAAVGLDPDDHEPLDRFIGPPLQETFAAAGLDPDAVKAAIGGYRSYFAVQGIFQNQVYEGIDGVLSALKAEGWLLGVATSKPEPFTERILEHFDLAHYFDVVAGSTMDGTRRHKVDVIAHAMALVAPLGGIRRAVMVGDRAVDINGAQAHGLGSIGVTWGYGSLDELVAAGPSALAAEPGEILELLA